MRGTTSQLASFTLALGLLILPCSAEALQVFTDTRIPSERHPGHHQSLGLTSGASYALETHAPKPVVIGEEHLSCQ